MAHPNSPNKIDDIAALLEIASKPKERKVKQPTSNPEIDKFIQECKIVSGKKRVPSYVIYYRYFLWKKTRLIDRRKFVSYLNTKFEKTKTTTGIGFLLNPKEFDLTAGGYFRARALLRKERDEKEKN